MIGMRKIALLFASVATALLFASGVALAALSDLSDPGTPGANGRLSDILVSGDTIYLAGSFTQITDKDGNTFTRNNLAAIDANTGAVTSWDPDARNTTGNSSVRTMALSSDGTRLFVGGTFTSVGGLTRNRLAAIDPVTGSVDKNWKGTGTNNVVRSLAVSGNRLYLGGDFTQVKGEPRQHLAAVDASTAALDSLWTPGATKADGTTSSVWALDVSADGSRIYAGGLFNTISVNGVATRTEKLAALDVTTGAVDPVFKPATQNHIIAMDVSGGNVYVGTGDPLEGIESFDGTTGQRRWSVPGGHPDPRAGDVQAITVWGDTVYAGGHGTLIGGLIRNRIFAADAATGTILPWAPNIPGGGGSLGVWAIDQAPSRNRLYVGGDFTQVTGQPRERFAQFSEAPPPASDCTLTGTPNDDVLDGTSGEDIICGGGGADTIKGLGGNDTLRGEGGSDKLVGGEGDDVLDGGSTGSTGNTADFSDSLSPVSASLVSNTASGVGSDTMVAIENLTGSKFNDTLIGSDANNQISGGGGDDTLSGLKGVDKLFGAGGNDTLRGGPGNDGLVGDGGADSLFGEEADDRLTSKDGVEGNDSVDGGTHVTGDTCITDATEVSIVGCEL
jgi:Ca2+-binding RTX toxin-like protein